MFCVLRVSCADKMKFEWVVLPYSNAQKRREENRRERQTEREEGG
jgi:hypothetical protein